MAHTTLGAKSEGSIVKIKENDVSVDFIVLKHGYPAAGNGRTLLLRHRVKDQRAWDSTTYSVYSTSAIDSWLNNAYLSSISEDIRNEIASVTIPYSTPTGGVSTLSRKVFLLSGTELCHTDASLNVEGTALAYFNTKNNKIAYNHSNAASSWWSRSPQALSAGYVWLVEFTGDLGRASPTGSSWYARPAFTLPSSILVLDDGSLVTSLPPSMPQSITVPENVLGGETITIVWGESTSPLGLLAGYKLERSVDGGAWTQIYAGEATAFEDTITLGWINVRYRVKAYDTGGAESGYMTSDTRTVINNRPPVISGKDDDLGEMTDVFMPYRYTVNDADGDEVTVKEAVNDNVFNTFEAVLGVEYELSIPQTPFLKLPNGAHTAAITATDEAGITAKRLLTFTKLVNGFSVKLTDPLAADTLPKRIKLAITRQLPVGASFTVEVCNNAYDTVPAWEDATAAVKNGTNYVFQNKSLYALQAGVNFRITVTRGTAIGECWVSGIEGNFD